MTEQDSPFLGSQLTGKVVWLNDKGAFLRLANGSAGWLPLRELNWFYPDPAAPLPIAKGAHVDVVIVQCRARRDGKGDFCFVSQRASSPNPWATVESVHRPDQRVWSTVIQHNSRAAVIVLDSGYRGFVPYSELSWYRDEQCAEHIPLGQRLEVAIVKLKPSKCSIACSRRTLLDNPWDSLHRDLPIGSRWLAEIVHVGKRGIIVVLPNRHSAFVHCSELSWLRRKMDPTTTFVPGQTVQVEVMGIDAQQHRIQASIRRTQANPWEMLRASADGIHRGTVSSITSFGLLVALPNGCVGLLHKSLISEAASTKHIGDPIDVKITEVDYANRRARLAPATWPPPTNGH